MRNRLVAQDGIAIVTAVVLMGVMMGAALGGYAYVDGQQRHATTDRVRESSFNLGEGVLNTQAFVLSQNWPGNASRAYPGCTSTGSNPSFCPDPDEIASGFDNSDYSSGTNWSTTVRDDYGTAPQYEEGRFYDATVVANRPSWDQNQNGKVWVRSQSTVNGRVRTLVALVEVERISEAGNLPKATIIAGHFKTTNNGNKTIVATTEQPRPGQPPDPTIASVHLRCTMSSPACAEYEANKGQVTPNSVLGDQYQNQTSLPADSTERLIERAKADGTYYATCPDSLTGAVVYVETCNRTYDGNVFNSDSAPGMLIVGDGFLELKSDFYGVIVHLNKANVSTDLVKVHANGRVYGRVYVDGGGGVAVGSTGAGGNNDPNIQYEDFDFATNAFVSYGAAGIVQNSWRELVAGS